MGNFLEVHGKSVNIGNILILKIANNGLQNPKK